MQEMDPKFLVMMAKLKLCYSDRVADEKTWESQIEIYWSKLHRFDLGFIGKAMDRALVSSPKFFPTLGVLLELTKTARNEAMARANEKKRLPASINHEGNLIEIRKIIASLCDAKGV